ncbi:MAG: transcriptional regulator, ArsR family [Frankiales bacterium]|jgi:DNA-binding transcriptional ArsR family regulator|nr:transcriptional regulator, ArsR family [Frankiales bacterium]
MTEPRTATARELQAFAAAAEWFNLLACPSRIQILWLLSEGERDVSSVAASLDLGLPTAGYHLTRLRSARFVTSQRLGRRLLYRLAPETNVNELLKQLIDSALRAV